MIPVQVEVCGLETVLVSSIKVLNYDFVIDKNPKEISMTD